VERPKHSRRRIAPSRVVAGNQRPLANITELIDHGGQITIGALRPVQCAAVANDEHDCLAMLQRKPGETLPQLLERLDSAIARAWETEEFTDEINVQLHRTKSR